jgi:hypothetical protein
MPSHAIRICDATLNHFQTHLDLGAKPCQESNPTKSPSSSTNVDKIPTLCLGESPAIIQTYYRAYTTIGMLLDLNRQAEEAFRRYSLSIGGPAPSVQPEALL